MDSKEENKSEVNSANLNFSKIEMKSDQMSGCHTCLFALILVIVICGTYVLSAVSQPMLKYNESAIYSCPEDYIEMTIADQEAD